MSYTPGRLVWYEHCSNDIAKARAFYGSCSTGTPS